MQLKNKTAVVTGGSRGIGKATAAALAGEGCRLAICGRNKTNLAKAKQELKAAGAGVLALSCDLTKPDAIRKFAVAIKKKFGRVDILVNNAGVAYYKPLKDSTEEEINETIDVNVRGMILLTKQLLPVISDNGIIVNISSGAGKHGYPGMAAYCASKFGVIGFTEALAGEIKQKVVAVCPGGVDTDMYRSMFGNRPGLKPEHIAAKIIEICAHPEKFSSGQAVNVYHITDVLSYVSAKYLKRKR